MGVSKHFQYYLLCMLNKIGHSSRSSSIQRSKPTAYQRCLVMFHNFWKFSFPSIEKKMDKRQRDRLTKRKEKKKKRKIRKKEKEKKKKKKKKKKKRKKNENENEKKKGKKRIVWIVSTNRQSELSSRGKAHHLRLWQPTSFSLDHFEAGGSSPIVGGTSVAVGFPASLID